MNDERKEGGAAPFGAETAAMALAIAAQNDRVVAKAETFLEQHATLAALQAEDIRGDLKLRHWSARVHHLSDVLKLGFELAAAVVVLAIAAFIGNAVWDAAHDHGVVIEAFQVPPDLANRGLTGQVIASRLLDRLTAMQNATQSARPAESYANNWGSDIKVQIPDTGVSIGDFDRYLRAWLGHETHIGGEIVQTANGVSVTARASGFDSASFSGPTASLDRLLQSAAERIYKQTQPYRYAVFRTHGLQGASEAEWNDARKVFTGLTLNPDRDERAWAWLGLGNIARRHDADARRGELYLRRAIFDKSEFGSAFFCLFQTGGYLGHSEAVVTYARASENVIRKLPPAQLQPGAMTYELALVAARDMALGDFPGAIANSAKGIELPDVGGTAESFRENIRVAQAFEHDSSAARARTQPKSAVPSRDFPLANRLQAALLVDVALGDWAGVAALEPAVEQLQRSAFPGWDNKAIAAANDRPWLALARGKLGDIAGAGRTIDTTPADCYDCVRVRGKVAALAHRFGAAAHWFAIAAKLGPSLPFAYADWGEMLLQTGKYDAAIAKFDLAHTKSPHFADPLELWGEALTQENRSDLALAKFAEANRYAPHWGRLHLEWGKALMWSGDTAGARKQFASAARLDLAPQDMAQLRTMERRI